MRGLGDRAPFATLQILGAICLVAYSVSMPPSAPMIGVREAAAVCARADSRDAALAPFEPMQISEGLSVRMIDEGTCVVTHSFPWAANSMLVEMGGSHLVLIDTPWTPEATRELLEWAEARFGDRDIVAINTGYHDDNLGGNRYLVEQGIPVYGSRLTARLLEERGDEMRSMMLEWLKAPQHKRYRDVYRTQQHVPPTHLFTLQDGLTLRFEDDAAQVHYPGPSHSPDNVVVYLPRRRVLFGGCMIVGMDRLGNTSDADLDSWPGSVRSLSRFDCDVVVPGHGNRLDPGLVDHTITLLEDRDAQMGELHPAVGRADSLLISAIENGVPGAVVLVGRSGEVVYERAMGSADLAHHVPMHLDTKIRVGSITKQFTAAAIMKLEEAGALRVTDRLSRFVPGHARGDEITLHHLLTHTSGVPNHTRKPGFWRRAVLPVQRDSLIAAILRDTLEFDPGRRCAYSSAGYELLGEVVEVASGLPWEDYLRESILHPLGLEDTDIHDWYVVCENLAYGYQFADGCIYRADERHASHFPASGGLYSTARDLFRWTEALFEGDIAGTASLATMTTPARTVDGRIAQTGPFSAGYGMGIRHVDGRPECSHGGGFNGYEAWVAHYPDESLTVVVLMNCNPGPDGAGALVIGSRLARLFWE